MQVMLDAVGLLKSGYSKLKSNSTRHFRVVVNKHILNMSCNCSSPSKLVHQPTPPASPILRPLPTHALEQTNKFIQNIWISAYHMQSSLNVLQFTFCLLPLNASQSQPLFLWAHETPIKATGKHDSHLIKGYSSHKKIKHQISLAKHKNRGPAKCKTQNIKKVLLTGKRTSKTKHCINEECVYAYVVWGRVWWRF